MDKKTKIKPVDKLAIRVIDELGGTHSTAKALGVSMPVVSMWKRKGLPKHMERFLRLAYPTLEAWKA